MAHPPYTPAERNARETFLALMGALSYPGRIYTLPETAPSSSTGEGLAHIGEALLDLETSFYTPDPVVAEALARTGAAAATPEAADYHFYTTLTPTILETIARARVGTMLRPDESASLFIGCRFDGETGLRWRGPGIDGSIRVALDDVPAAFWQLRAEAIRYPLGWDVYLVDGARVLGLPRTTAVEPLAG